MRDLAAVGNGAAGARPRGANWAVFHRLHRIVRVGDLLANSVLPLADRFRSRFRAEGTKPGFETRISFFLRALASNLALIAMALASWVRLG